nr:hypothetical protein B0A51_16499 [Rachicladosporium sp. CCFEE 5018]
MNNFTSKSVLRPLQTSQVNFKLILHLIKQLKRDITKRPWSTRVWAVQEVVLAREALIVSGSDTLPWNDYDAGIEFGKETGVFETSLIGYARDPEPTFPNMTAQSELILSSQDSAATLLGLLHRHRFREATNPADKVYSMLGLVGKNIADLEIGPDYTLPYQQVYRDVARSILIYRSILDFVGMAEPIADSSSWVPDWTRPPQTTPLTVNKAELPLLTQASRRATPELRISGQGDVLILKGHTIDRIVENAGHLDLMLDDWFDEVHDSEFEAAQTKVPDDAPLSQNVSAFLQDVPELLRYLGHRTHSAFHELFRFLDPLERFVEWGKLARIHDKGPGRFKADILAAYLEVLTAGNDLPGGPEATKLVFEEWLESLAPIRNLLKVRSAIMKLYKTLAFAGHLRKTWQIYGKFGDVLDHAYNRRTGRTAQGRLALLPRSAAVGDLVAVCKGGRVPLCLRPTDELAFTLIGEAYVHGVMDGEAFDEERCEAIPIR